MEVEARATAAEARLPLCWLRLRLVVRRHVLLRLSARLLRLRQSLLLIGMRVQLLSLPMRRGRLLMRWL